MKGQLKIVLLSGGSGERLWPLSNDEKSKQFLMLLEAPDGRSESMVQRIVRQLREAGMGDNIVVVTNSRQSRMMREQLGSSVEIITEPERRNTFPAIALAAEYLSQEKHCPDDEVVVVMPCDPFTEAGYFEVLGKMARTVEEGRADLALMGIRPDCPSSKYGYIVPEGAECGEEVIKVAGFKEKPDAATAEGLIAKGALWNGGVFAFRLGYLKRLSRKYVSGDFDSILSSYSDYPRISFDYEVAEKALNTAAVRFNGKWKDLGTWNALSEELPSTVKGRVVTGKNLSNTHVINELGIPIFVDGLSDVMVVASPEGILVCNKDDSEALKDYLGDLK